MRSETGVGRLHFLEAIAMNEMKRMNELHKSAECGREIRAPAS